MLLILFSLIFVPAHAQKLVQAANDTLWAATPAQIEASPYFPKQAISIGEIDQWLRRERPAMPQTRATIKGIQFDGENTRLIVAFKALTDRTGVSDFTSSCQTVRCAVEEVFGAGIGLKLLFMFERYGFNGTHLGDLNADAWTSSELDLLLRGLACFPEHTFPQRNRRNINHFKRGYVPAQFSVADAQGLVADSKIRMYDRWDTYPNAQKIYAVFHEVSHVLAVWNGQIDLQDRWKNIDGGWIQHGDSWTPSVPNKIISTYGRENPLEDFAETMSAYRFNAEGLKTFSPKRYEFVRQNFFDGLEYTSSNLSSSEKAVSENFRQEILRSLEKQPADDTIFSSVATRCGRVVLAGLGAEAYDSSNDPKLASCIAEAFKTAVLTREIKKRWPSGSYSVQVLALSNFIPDSVIATAAIQQATLNLVNELKSVLSRASQLIFEKAVGIYRGSCTDAAQYAYQSIDAAEPEFNARFGPGSPSIAFDYRVQLVALMTPVCESLKSTYGARKSIGEAMALSVISPLLN
jgi:hypothetical protein